MNLEDRLSLIKKNSEELILENEVMSLLQEKNNPRSYIGFELSGLLHLGTGLVCGNKFKDMAQAGFNTIVFLADWHSWINNKLDADRCKIEIAGDYFKKGFESLGITGPNIDFVWGSSLVDAKEYWEKVIRIAKNSTLQRIMRTLPAMGRNEEEDLESAYLYYPAMQCADIFEMGIDIAIGGMDQRKVHMLARDVAEKMNRTKPICLHLPLLAGLQGLGTKMDSETLPDLVSKIAGKMSKSNPDTCIFIHDTKEEIQRKIKKAICPPKVTDGNPIIDIVHYILFDQFDELTIERPAKYGGDLSFSDYRTFEKMYKYGDIHPLDVKNMVSIKLNEILKPSRKYFDKHSGILEEMKTIQSQS